jgi:hypothetical protein
MHIGCQFRAPQGWGSLVPDATYYLFCNRPDLGSITLAWFTQAKTDWRVYLIRLPREDVEAALHDKRLIVAPEQATLPPWLEAIEGMSLDGLEDGRVNPVHTYREHATSRLRAITPFLTDDFDRAFDGAPRPDKFFKRRLKEIWLPKGETAPEPQYAEPTEPVASVGPKPNALRALLWYCSFRLFGRELDALLPAFAGIGRWSRAEWVGDGTRLGRPKKHTGAGQGHSAVGLATRIQDAYARFGDVGVTMVAIRRRALREEFGCMEETLANGHKRTYHPDGLPFPSYQSFRYWALKAFGLEAVQKKRWGEARFRTRQAARVGSFSQDSANYLETGEADVYHIPELPRQLLSTDPAPPLLVCRLADMVTANIFGVGFSAGGEKAEAYALAKFCAVVPRKLMGRLFGIPLTEEDWPGRGHPSRGIYDRGAGSSPKADGVGQAASPIKELAPSWSGQSKGTVESSHPRNVSLDGEPTYTVSKLNVFQMAAREMLRTPAENHRKDAVGRLTPQMLLDGVAGNPAAITKYLVEKLRTSAIPMSTEVAIRKYLRPVEFVQKPDGLWLEVLQFSHAHLHAHGLPARVPTGHPTIIKGYVYPYSLYLAWVEIGGRLYEVEPLLRIREDREQLRITLADLHRLAELRREAAALQREHGAAAMSEFDALFIELFGERPDAVDRKRGKKPRPTETEKVPMASAPAKKAAA